MMDKTMCEVLWRNISDFYVNLRVEVGKPPTGNFSDVFFILDKNNEPVPEMDGRQMRLISYSGDQKLLQIR